MTTSAPIFTPPDDAVRALRDDGYALLAPGAVAALAGVPLAELDLLIPSWNALALDNYLKDGGRYRRRRHSCFVQDGVALTQTAHRAHWQPLEYNALHGGMHRLFEPMLASTVAQPAWPALVGASARCAPPPGASAAPASRGTSRRTSSASIPPTASAARRRKARTATASISSP